MAQKRGWLMVVLMLLVFLLLPISFGTEHDAGGLATNQDSYYAVRDTVDDDDVGDCDNNGLDSFEWFRVGEGFTCGPGDARPADYGCWVRAVEWDGGLTGDNDCGWAKIKEGIELEIGQHDDWDEVDSYSGTSGVSDAWGWDGHDGGCALHTYNFRNVDTAKLCADDHLWHACGVEGTIGTVSWANDILYNCTLDELGVATWEQIDTDVDHDGYISSQDCDDDPRGESAACSELETRDDCANDPLKYAACAICINPGAVEICGDNINNDCGGVDAFENRNEDEGNTPDNCNLFEAGCEQTTIRTAGAEEGEPETGIDQRNIYDESFSWTDTEEGGYCCGYRGIEDLGQIVTSPEGGGQRICLNKNIELVGREGDLSCDGEENWCWATATTESFHIFTVKKPGEEAYDVVSNNNKWIECQEQEGMRDISAPDTVVDPDDIEKANRFYCYQEGNRWSWADCRNPQEATEEALNGAAKLRGPGDGLFAFQLDQLEPTDSVSINLEDVYEPYYEQSSVNFASIDDLSLEFFVRFTTLEQLPADVILNIFGPEQNGERAIYYSQPVLGYAVNTPLLEPNRWIHVKVPLPEMVGVTLIRFDVAPAGGRNIMEIRNVYLNSATAPKLCSGERSRTNEQSSWLENPDFSSPSSSISGEKLCNELYDPAYDPATPELGKAWLGDYDEVDLVTANCCGNNENEYYSDQSREVNGVRYGCWNSQPIASGETTMNVGFEAEYIGTSTNITYPEIPFNVDVQVSTPRQTVVNYQCPSVVNEEGRCTDYHLYCDNIYTIDGTPNCGVTYPFCEVLDDGCSQQYYPDEDGSCSVEVRRRLNSDDSWQTYRPVLPCDRAISSGAGLTVETPADIPTNFEGLVYVQSTEEYIEISGLDSEETDYGSTISLLDSPQRVGEISVNKNDFAVGIGYRGGVTFNTPYPQPQLDFYFINSRDPSVETTTIDAGDLSPGQQTIYLMAKTSEGYIINLEEQNLTKRETFTYTCNQATGECLYPLPGNPPYHLTNLHPDLYDLYFVSVEGDEVTETPILQPNQEFTTEGNIKAKKVAQQIIFLSEGEDAVDEPSFYGCQAADFVAGNVDENLNYCAVKAGKFCSPSVALDDGRERFTTINSWSDESLTAVGYAPLEAVEENVSLFYQNTEIPLRTTGTDLPITPTERNYSAFVLPARNIIPNAEFIRNANALPHWDIVNPDGSIKENIRSNLDETTHTITLAAGEVLRSERIAIPSNRTLAFSQNLTCDLTLAMIDKDGTTVGEVTNLTAIQTETASYLRLEFTGPCSISQPMLQLVDDLDLATYDYTHQGYPDGFDARAGLSCCPQNYCWNGYACVAPMESITYLAEHISEGRDYRCINGEWKHLPVKYDWNEQQWGFCEQEEQCFVLSSTEGASIENTAQSFYEGEYPTCINDTEYILDNLCEQGNWTSRTKFVASKLLEVGETDEYVLYCTNYRQALVEMDNRENYIGGEFSQVQESTSTLAETLLGPAEQESFFTCFDQILDPEGRRLVRDKDNTCVNNVCVLQFKEGGDFKVAFATTLNKNLTSEDSFLLALNVPQDQLNQVCTGSEGFVQCDLAGLDIPGNLWYSPELNAVIYGKEGIQLDPNLLERIRDWFRNFFGVPSELSDEATFLSQARNFRELYLSHKSGKEVRAMQEILGSKQTLTAEYARFQTPVCDYIRTLRLPPEVEAELLETLSEREKVSCSSVNETQRVEIIAGLDFFWPQLTANLRTE